MPSHERCGSPAAPGGRPGPADRGALAGRGGRDAASRRGGCLVDLVRAVRNARGGKAEPAARLPLECSRAELGAPEALRPRWSGWPGPAPAPAPHSRGRCTGSGAGGEGLSVIAGRPRRSWGRRRRHQRPRLGSLALRRSSPTRRLLEGAGRGSQRVLHGEAPAAIVDGARHARRSWRQVDRCARAGAVSGRPCCRRPIAGSWRRSITSGPEAVVPLEFLKRRSGEPTSRSDRPAARPGGRHARGGRRAGVQLKLYYAGKRPRRAHERRAAALADCGHARGITRAM